MAAREGHDVELFDEVPRIGGDRILLREMTEGDVASLEELCQSEAVYRHEPTFLYEQRYDDKALVISRMREECRLANTCDDDTQRLMYERLIDLLEEAGFEHYEISNFAKKSDTPYPTFRSRHNSSYWNGTPYIGIGAAAHSYDRVTRQWNVSDIGQYIQAVMNKERPIEETELLDDATRYNDLITTALRTREGISMTELKRTFPDFFFDYLTANAAKGIQRHLLEVTDGRLHLTRQGLFVSNDVMSDLVYVEP